MTTWDRYEYEPLHYALLSNFGVDFLVHRNLIGPQEKGSHYFLLINNFIYYIFRLVHDVQLEEDSTPEDNEIKPPDKDNT